MDSNIQKFKAVFLEEASELLNQLEKNLLELEINSENIELIDPVFRGMHTLKGTSGMYGFYKISELTHGLESIFQQIKERKLCFNNIVFDIALKAVDLIRELLIDENLSKEHNLTRFQDLIHNIDIVLHKSSDAKPCLSKSDFTFENRYSTWQIILILREHHYFRGININGILQDLATLGRFEISRFSNACNDNTDTWSIILYSNASEKEIREVFLFIEDDCTFLKLTNINIFEDSLENNVYVEPSITEYIDSVVSIANRPNISNKETGDYPSINNCVEASIKSVKRISVDSSKLDHLMFLVSELITLNSQLSLNTAEEKFEKIRPFTERLEVLSKQFRTNALDIRLVPLNESVFRYKRLIRDLSKQLKKEVSLITEGTETEVDKGTLDELNDPLMHIIRNCLDHGIEESHERINKGKNPKGVIKILACNSGNHIIIKIEDDGSGIDLERIRLKAIDSGIIKKNDIPSKQELLDMIFLPGFSTARNLTEISGRGVGLDVVKNRITNLKGEVLIESEEGIGTCFILKLRQSITIIDTLLFQVSNYYFTIPVLDINCCMELSSKEITLRRNTGTCVYDNQIIPFLDLREKLNIDGNYDEKIKAIIISFEGKKLSLLADSIIGSHQAVIKPLGNLFSHQKFIGAASQLGDGKLAFMLETRELFQLNL